MLVRAITIPLAAVAISSAAFRPPKVVAHCFEFDAEWVEPERGVVVTRILRKVLRSVNDAASYVHEMIMNAVDQRAAPNHEREVL
jgi:hypothetical protein